MTEAKAIETEKVRSADLAQLAGRDSFIIFAQSSIFEIVLPPRRTPLKELPTELVIQLRHKANATQAPLRQEGVYKPSNLLQTGLLVRPSYTSQMLSFAHFGSWQVQDIANLLNPSLRTLTADFAWLSINMSKSSGLLPISRSEVTIRTKLALTLAGQRSL